MPVWKDARARKLVSSFMSNWRVQQKLKRRTGLFYTTSSSKATVNFVGQRLSNQMLVTACCAVLMVWSVCVCGSLRLEPPLQCASVRLVGWYGSFLVYNGNSVKLSPPFFFWNPQSFFGKSGRAQKQNWRFRSTRMESGYVLGIGCMSVKEIPSSALIRSGWWWGPMMLDVWNSLRL